MLRSIHHRISLKYYIALLAALLLYTDLRAQRCDDADTVECIHAKITIEFDNLDDVMSHYVNYLAAKMDEKITKICVYPPPQIASDYFNAKVLRLRIEGIQLVIANKPDRFDLFNKHQVADLMKNYSSLDSEKDDEALEIYRNEYEINKDMYREGDIGSHEYRKSQGGLKQKINKLQGTTGVNIKKLKEMEGAVFLYFEILDDYNNNENINRIRMKAEVLDTENRYVMSTDGKLLTKEFIIANPTIPVYNPQKSKRANSLDLSGN